MADFRVNLGDNGEIISQKRDVTIQDTANPFGNQAIVKIEDDTGEQYDKFSFGQRVEIDARQLQTDFEVQNAEDITIAENETVTIREENRTIAEGETLTVGEFETETGKQFANQGRVANAGTVTSQYEIREQRVWSNAGRVSNYDVARSIADTPREDYQQRFSGYAVKRDDKKQSGGRDLTEVTIYSFDQLLRADSVTNDQSGKTITAALEDIIKTDTAVTWNAANVTVEDEQTLSESLQGAKVEDALLKLAVKSVNESIGVNDDLEFFFREEETVSAPNNITESNWIDYELPERGEENKNEARTYYQDGDRVAVVDDGVNQLELQESLGTDDPVVIAQDRERDDLNTTDDAAEESEQNLRDKEVSRVYRFTTEAGQFLNAEPGQTLDVTISAAGIDDEFRIAAIEYNDRAATAELTCIRNKGNTDDVLRRVTERLRRKELENADFDGPQDRINIAEVGIILENSATVDGTTWDRTRITNDFRNLIRDGWGGQGNVDVSEIAVGTDPADLSRTNNSLKNEVARTSVSEALNGTDGVTYDASVSQTDIQEIGLFDSSGNLLYRAVNDTAESPGNISISLTVQNDAEVPKAVVTNLGQESIRDIIADNGPDLPERYGFGSDQTEPDVSDTSLGTSEYVADLTEFLTQEATTQSSLDSLVGDISDDVPITVQNSNIETQQTSIWREIEEFDGATGDVTTTVNSDDGASADTYATFQFEGSEAEFDVSFDHRIPNDDIEIRYRWTNDSSVGGTPQSFEFYLNGDLLVEDRSTTLNNYEFERTNNDPNDLDDDWGFRDDIQPGETYTIKVVQTTSDGDEDFFTKFDGISIGDKRQSVDLPASLDGSTDYLAGPQDYPQQAEVQFDETATTRRELDFARAVLDIDDTSNGQFIELSNDGGSNFIRTNNTDDATANFSSLSREVISRIGLSRHGSRTDETPTEGFEPQQISSWTLFTNPLAVVPDGIGVVLTEALIPRNEITGSSIRELGQLDSSGNTLTRTIRAELEVATDMRVIGRERLTIRQS